MREKLAVALNSKNLASKFDDCALDKIHAIGIAAQKHAVGVDAIRFTDGLQPRAYNSLIYGLAKACKGHFKCERSIMIKMCKQVVHEHSFPFCLSCRGRKEMQINDKLLQCHACEGSGVTRYQDLQRALAIGVSLSIYQKFLASRFKTVQSVFTWHYKSALKVTAKVSKID